MEKMFNFRVKQQREWAEKEINQKAQELHENRKMIEGEIINDIVHYNKNSVYILKSNGIRRQKKKSRQSSVIESHGTSFSQLDNASDSASAVGTRKPSIQQIVSRLMKSKKILYSDYC